MAVPDTLVGDGREPGRWGPRGTHVSQIKIGEEKEKCLDSSRVER
jgi:hypothetical protein